MNIRAVSFTKCLLLCPVVIVILFLIHYEPVAYVTRIKDESLSNKGTPSSQACNDVLEIQMSNSSDQEAFSWAIKNLGSMKRDLVYGKYEYYKTLSSKIPSYFEESEPFKGISGSNLTVAQANRLDRLHWKVPYLPCRLRKYEAEDVAVCFERKSSNFEKPFHMSFMGDSRLRRIVESLLELIHIFDLTITTANNNSISVDDFLGDKGNILWPKYKQQFNVKSKKLQNFLISFYWAPFLSSSTVPYENVPHYMKYLEDNEIFREQKSKRKRNQVHILDDNTYVQKFKEGNLNISILLSTRWIDGAGGLDELRKWLTLNHEQLPHYLFLNTAIWGLVDGIDLLQSIDKEAITGTLKLRRVLEDLSSRTKVVMLLPEPIKKIYVNSRVVGFSHTSINNEIQEWYLNAQAHILPKNVLLWDSFIPFYYAAIQDCFSIADKNINILALPNFQRFDKMETMACNQRMHTGYEAISLAVQMLLNHICNEIMPEDKDPRSLCCANSL